MTASEAHSKTQLYVSIDNCIKLKSGMLVAHTTRICDVYDVKATSARQCQKILIYKISHIQIMLQCLQMARQMCQPVMDYDDSRIIMSQNTKYLKEQ